MPNVDVPSKETLPPPVKPESADKLIDDETNLSTDIEPAS